MNEEKIGICADIDDLVDAYESRMTRERAQKIVAAFSANQNCDWVFLVSENQLKLDGNFTADEIEAFAWCLRNDTNMLDLANGI